jgi:hypothetical protein
MSKYTLSSTKCNQCEISIGLADFNSEAISSFSKYTVASSKLYFIGKLFKALLIIISQPRACDGEI